MIYKNITKADITWTFVEYQTLFTRREAELNIISLRVNKFDIQKKSMQYLLYYILFLKKMNKMKKHQFNSNIEFNVKCVQNGLADFYLLLPAIKI